MGCCCIMLTSTVTQLIWSVVSVDSYDSMMNLCDKYNRAIDSIRQLVRCKLVIAPVEVPL